MIMTTNTKFLHTAVIVILAAVFLYRSPYNASNLDIAPDAVEYAAGAYRLASNSSYDIVINSKSFPPRYPPWFSTLFLAPSIKLAGNNPDYAICPVYILAIAAVTLIFLIGFAMGGTWGGLLSSLLMLSIEDFRFLSGQVMTDIPCLCIFLLLAIIYSRLKNKGPSTRLYITAGILIAVSSGMRPATSFFIIPFLWMLIRSRSFVLRCFSALIIPVILVSAATLLYNNKTFGSPFRTGYNFWCPVPYDYTPLCISARYFMQNAKILILNTNSIYALVAIATLIFVLKRPQNDQDSITKTGLTNLSDFACFAGLSLIPLGLLHLFYFYSEARFYLPITASTVIFAGSMAGLLLSKISTKYSFFILLVASCLLIVLKFHQQPEKPVKRISADNILLNTPPNAIIITAIEPAYFTLFPQTGSRYIMPLNRKIEYASKIIAPRKIADPKPYPTSCLDHRCSGLIAKGAIDPIPKTFDESIVMITDMLKDGLPVYYDNSWICSWDLPEDKLLKSSFNIQSVSKNLYRLTSRKTQ